MELLTFDSTTPENRPKRSPAMKKAEAQDIKMVKIDWDEFNRKVAVDMEVERQRQAELLKIIPF